MFWKSSPHLTPVTLLDWGSQKTVKIVEISKMSPFLFLKAEAYITHNTTETLSDITGIN